MKQFIAGTFLAAFLTTVSISLAQAQETSIPSTRSSSIAVTTTPFDLVSLAYQGFLESEGVPKFNRLIFAYRTGRITAEDLVQGAIDTRRLPAEAINNQRYLSSVERQLDDLLTGNSN